MARILWQSLDPRTQLWVRYEDSVIASLESQYRSGQSHGQIQVFGQTFKMDFTPGRMLQINSQGLGRRVQRKEGDAAGISPLQLSQFTTFEACGETKFQAPANIEWYSEDPRTGDWVAYDEAASAWLELQFKSGEPHGTVRVAGMLFDIDFTEGAMQQINQEGYARSVQRVVSGDSIDVSPTHRRRRPSSSEGAALKWRSLDPRIGRWIDYPAATCSYLEAQYQRGKVSCQLNIGGHVFVVYFESTGMWQENEQGAWREVERATWIGDSVQWRSQDPRTGQWVDYDSVTTASLEAQYQEGKAGGMICIGDMTFAVDFTADCMKQVNDSGLCRDVQRIGASTYSTAGATSTLSVVKQNPVQEPAAANRPVLYVEGKGWREYEPDPHSVIVIGPGAGTRANADVYKELQSVGFKVAIINGGSYDKYPPGWQDGCPDVSFNHGQNLAALADDDVYCTILDLVKKGKGPCALIAGSRGGQVTAPRLWKRGWRGPTVVINAGCVTTTQIPGPPVRLALYTCGRDFFHTSDPDFTKDSIQKKDSSQPVLLYHHPSEGHMPSRLGQGVLQRLVEVARDGFEDAQLAVGPGGGHWPTKAIIEKI